MEKKCTVCSTELGKQPGIPSLLSKDQILCRACAQGERLQIKAQYAKAKKAFEESDALVRQMLYAGAEEDAAARPGKFAKAA